MVYRPLFVVLPWTSIVWQVFCFIKQFSLDLEKSHSWKRVCLYEWEQMKDYRFKCLLLRLTPGYGFFDLGIVDKITHIARLIFCFKHTDTVRYCKFKFSQFSSVQSLSCVLLFVTPRTAAHQASLSITNSWSLLKLMSIESMMPSNHLLLPSIFPNIRVFSNE